MSTSTADSIFQNSALLKRLGLGRSSGSDTGTTHHQTFEDSLHFDVLSFLSTAVHCEVDLIGVSYQTGLGEVDKGGTSSIVQTQLDPRLFLAFKRPNWDEDPDNEIGTAKLMRGRWKVLCHELIALEALRDHPNVIDLLGITWDLDVQNREVWPVMLTEKSPFGNLANFLKSEEGKKLDTRERLRICEDIAGALASCHETGIIHCDVKSENVVIFKHNGSWVPNLIDFGYCTIYGEGDEIQISQGTIPWQAPEIGFQFFSYGDALKVDLFSYGTVVTRTLLSDEFEEIGLYERSASGSDDKKKAIKEIELLKDEGTLLQRAVGALDTSLSLGNDLKLLCKRLLEGTLATKAEYRVSSFSELLVEFDREGKTKRDAVSVASSAQRAFSSLHTILPIESWLANLDEIDILVHHQLFIELEHRVQNTCPCQAAAARELAICHSIGFGTRRDPKRAKEYISKAQELDQRTPMLTYLLQSLHYDATEPERTIAALGHRISIPYDPIEPYIRAGRADELLHYLRHEVDDRIAALSPENEAVADRLSVLALLLMKIRRLKEAEEVCRRGYDLAVKSVGPESDVTLGVQNFLAHIMLEAGSYVSLLEMLPTLISIKTKKYGPTNDSVMKSRNDLGILLTRMGQYDRAIKELSEVLAIRKETKGDEQIETLNTTRCLADALLQSGQVDTAEKLLIPCLYAAKRVSGEQSDLTLRLMELYARLMLAVGEIDGAKEIITDSMIDSEEAFGLDDVLSALTARTWAYICGMAQRKKGTDGGKEKKANKPESVSEETPPHEAMEDIIGRFEAIYEESHPAVVETLAIAAEVFIWVGGIQRAKELVQEAMRLHQNGRFGDIPRGSAFERALAWYKKETENH